MKKNKYIICMIFLAALVFSLAVFLPDIASAQDYKPLENIPGTQSTSGDWVKYVQSIYKFGVWAVGIAALFMIMIGGIMYIGSAGNNATMGKAKGIITDAIIGLIMVLTAYLLLYEINPDLLKITVPKDLSMAGNGSNGGGGSDSGNRQACLDRCDKSGYKDDQLKSCKDGCPAENAGNKGSGKCEPVTSGPCSPDSLNNSCFSGIADVNKISSICNAESGGVETMSKVDKCGRNSSGTSFSCGALQVNLTCVCKGQGAFTGSEPAKGCANFKCTGAGPNYQSCVDKNCYGQGNMNAACQMYKEHRGNKYDTWSKNKECGF